jgi:hypothetical protein
LSTASSRDFKKSETSKARTKREQDREKLALNGLFCILQVVIYFDTVNASNKFKNKVAKRFRGPGTQ